jgi:hypothetical protein
MAFAGAAPVPSIGVLISPSLENRERFRFEL